MTEQRSLADRVRALADFWADGARMAHAHGKQWTTTPEAMQGRVTELLSIAAELERVAGEVREEA